MLQVSFQESTFWHNVICVCVTFSQFVIRIASKRWLGSIISVGEWVECQQWMDMLKDVGNISNGNWFILKATIIIHGVKLLFSIWSSLRLLLENGITTQTKKCTLLFKLRLIWRSRTLPTLASRCEFPAERISTGFLH